jgi:hypothetical protein
MSATTNNAWPLPDASDPPDGPAQVGALGNAIDATYPRVRAGANQVTITSGNTAGTLVINMPAGFFPYTGQPVIVTVAPQNTQSYRAYVVATSAASITIAACTWNNTTVGSNVNVSVHWIATQVPA